MIEQCAVITRTGIVLWAFPPQPVPAKTGGQQDDVVASLIRNVLISSNPNAIRESTGLSSSAKKSSAGDKAVQVYQEGQYEVKWRNDNDLDVVYVAVYQRALHLKHVDDLLDRIQKNFAKLYGPRVKDPKSLISADDEYDFDERFKKLRIESEEGERRARPVKGGAQSSKASPTEETNDEDESTEAGEDDSTVEEPASALGKNTDHLDEDGPTKRLSPRLAALRSKSAKGSGKKPPSKGASPEPDSGKKKKAPRTWDGQAVTGDAAKALDFSNSEDGGQADTKKIEEQWIDKGSLGQRTRDGLYEAAEMKVDTTNDESDEDDDTPAAASSSSSSSSGGVFGFFKSLTGNRTLTEADLTPVMNQMREHLINKNVAANIAAQLTESVGSALVGQKIGTFQRVASAVREQIELALQRILTPRTSTDLLRDILAARKEGRPYSIVFCGVNGVGKSTNLAKVCFWLLQNGLKVLIAGCDTFRSGAVEQLKVHQRNLNALSRDGRVDLFERGYGKDAAGIAKEAITFAKNSNFDVVLIDTAGRMQDNEPLMRALAKLVTTNNPDKIIFVGEALVGNEAVDQLTKFNRSLRDFSGVQHPREIDGMILTKFDTIDDKVGAAISMTYITGKPIFFVGTGQTYTDLKKLSVPTVVATLLK